MPAEFNAQLSLCAKPVVLCPQRPYHKLKCIPLSRCCTSAGRPDKCCCNTECCCNIVLHTTVTHRREGSIAGPVHRSIWRGACGPHQRQLWQPTLQANHLEGAGKLLRLGCSWQRHTQPTLSVHVDVSHISDVITHIMMYASVITRIMIY